VAFLRKYPLLLPALSLGVGIITGRNIDIFFGAAIFASSAALLYLTFKRKEFWIFLFCAFFSIGALIIQRELFIIQKYQVTSLKERKVSLRGVCLEEPRIYRKGKLTRTNFLFEIHFKETREKIWVSLINAQGAVHFGDELLLFGKIKPVKRKQIGRPRLRLVGIGRKSYYIMKQDVIFSPFRRLNGYFSNKFKGLLPEREASFLKAIILGQRADMSRESQDQFRRLGIFHILSVSGFHMAAIAFFLYFLGRIFLLSPRYSIFLILIGLFLYFSLSGGRPPAFRAFIMALALCVGKLIGRGTNGLNSLCLASLTALIICPFDILYPSFQLSYTVVLGLILTIMLSSKGKPPSRKPALFFKIKKYGMDALKISTAAFLFSYGWVSFYFGGVSFFTILINVILLPLFILTTSLGFLLAFMSNLGDGIGGFFSLLVFLPTWVLLEAVRILSGLPVFNREGPVFGPEMLVGYYSVLFLAFSGLMFRRRIREWVWKRQVGKFFKKVNSR